MFTVQIWKARFVRHAHAVVVVVSAHRCSSPKPLSANGVWHLSSRLIEVGDEVLALRLVVVVCVSDETHEHSGVLRRGRWWWCMWSSAAITLERGVSVEPVDDSIISDPYRKGGVSGRMHWRRYGVWNVMSWNSMYGIPRCVGNGSTGDGRMSSQIQTEAGFGRTTHLAETRGFPLASKGFGQDGRFVRTPPRSDTSTSTEWRDG